MKMFRWLVFLCAPMLLLAQPPLRLKVPPAGPEVYQTPPASGRIHIIVQFPALPTAATLLDLTSRGAVILQYVPDFGVLINVGVNTDLTSLGLHYDGALTPQQKISPLIANGDPSVIRGHYVVEFHLDVDPSTARRIILDLPNVDLVENPDLLSRHLLVHIPDLTREGEALAALAVQDEVEYIFPASSEIVQGLQVSGVDDGLNQNIATIGDGWDGPGRNAATLGYFFSQMTAQLPAGVTEGEILRAMAAWAAVVQITWTPAISETANRTVNFRFATGDHGVGYSFDGRGGILAHAFFPAPLGLEPLAGDVHFDDAESWHIGSDFDVFSVALHELGHALGLAHSDDPTAVMYPYYRIWNALAPTDKASVLSLYAAKDVVTPVPLSLTISATPATTTAVSISLSGTVAGGTGGASVAWYSSTTGASGSATLTGANWLVASITLALGLNTITVSANDTTGHTHQTVTITRQTVTAPPLVLTVNATPSVTTATSISLSGTVTGGSGAPAVSWTTNIGAFDGSSISGTGWTISNIPLAIGLNVITVTAADTTSSVSRNVSVTRQVAVPPVGSDTTGPTLTITYPATTSIATTLTSLTFRGTASDRSGVASVTWSTNTGGAGTASGTTAWSAVIPLLIGSNQVIIRSTDTLGNMSWRSVVVARR